MDALKVVRGADVDAVLQERERVYLVGHLERKQDFFDHIGDLASPVEAGISRYGETTAEQPHLHEWNTDLILVMSGTYAVRLIASGETSVMTAGDLCVIEPGTAHACVAGPGTQVLFVKVPGGNDKVPVDVDDAAVAWIDQQLGELA